MNIGDKYMCLRDIKLNERKIYNSKYMIVEIISIEERDGNTYVKVSHGANIYEIVAGLLRDSKYFKKIS